MKSRVADARKMFEEGYNCCQSVFVTYADLYGIERETALKLASPMGAGVGRMREICGTVSAMALLAGLKQGNTDPGDEQKKAEIYELVRVMSDCFEQEFGSIICRKLLALDEKLEGKSREESAAPSARTKTYYEERPCGRFVEAAAGIIEEMLFNKGLEDNGGR